MGRDMPPHLKYNTTMKSEFVDHSKRKHETVAQMVGVERHSPRFAIVSPPFLLTSIKAYPASERPCFLRS